MLPNLPTLPLAFPNLLKTFGLAGLLLAFTALLFAPSVSLAQEAEAAPEPAAETSDPAQMPEPEIYFEEEEETTMGPLHPLSILFQLVFGFGASVIVTFAAFKVMNASGTWGGFLVIAAADALTLFIVRTLLYLTFGHEVTLYIDHGIAFFVAIPVIKRFSYVHDWVDAVKLAIAIRLATWIAGMLLRIALIWAYGILAN